MNLFNTHTHTKTLILIFNALHVIYDTFHLLTRHYLFLWTVVIHKIFRYDALFSKMRVENDI